MVATFRSLSVSCKYLTDLIDILFPYIICIFTYYKISIRHLILKMTEAKSGFENIELRLCNLMDKQDSVLLLVHLSITVITMERHDCLKDNVIDSCCACSILCRWIVILCCFHIMMSCTSSILCRWIVILCCHHIVMSCAGSILCRWVVILCCHHVMMSCAWSILCR